MAVVTEESSAKAIADVQSQDSPLNGLSGLAEGLEPGPATKEELDDYEEVLSRPDRSKRLKQFFADASMTWSIHSVASVQSCILLVFWKFPKAVTHELARAWPGAGSSNLGMQLSASCPSVLKACPPT